MIDNSFVPIKHVIILLLTDKYIIRNRCLTFAMCSSHLPSDINTNNIGVVSKKVLGLVKSFLTIATIITTREYT